MKSIIIHWQSVAEHYARWARRRRTEGDNATAIYYQHVSAMFAKKAREELINDS